MSLNLSPTAEGTRLHTAVEYRFLPRLGPVSRLLENLLMNHMLRHVLQQNQSSLNAYLAREPHRAQLP